MKAYVLFKGRFYLASDWFESSIDIIPIIWK